MFGDNFEKLQNAHVLVCGCGGVGGFCIDSLFRSGVGHISVIDCDSFEVTNQNRQLHSEFLNSQKAQIFKQIYNIDCFDIRLDKNIIENFDFSKYDLIIDAIDDVPAKISLASTCHKKLISSMGAAKRLDPTKIKIDSIWNTHTDPFAKKIRYELKKINFQNDFPVVFSTEIPNCINLGSFIGVTASFGLVLSSLAIKKIIE